MLSNVESIWKKWMGQNWSRLKRLIWKQRAGPMQAFELILTFAIVLRNGDDQMIVLSQNGQILRIPAGSVTYATRSPSFFIPFAWPTMSTHASFVLQPGLRTGCHAACEALAAIWKQRPRRQQSKPSHPARRERNAKQYQRCFYVLKEISYELFNTTTTSIEALQLQ